MAFCVGSEFHSSALRSPACSQAPPPSLYLKCASQGPEGINLTYPLPIRDSPKHTSICKGYKEVSWVSSLLSVLKLRWRLWIQDLG